MSKLGKWARPNADAPANVQQQPATEAAEPAEQLVALTFRLPRGAWLDLKLLSATLRQPISALVIEGLTLLAEAKGHTFEVRASPRRMT